MVDWLDRFIEALNKITFKGLVTLTLIVALSAMWHFG